MLNSAEIMNCARQNRAWKFFFACIGLSTLPVTSLLAQNGPKLLRSPSHAFVSQYCASCHDAETKKGELDLESISSEDATRHTEVWEKVVRRLRTRQMPPPEKKRPNEATYSTILSQIETSLD